MADVRIKNTNDGEVVEIDKKDITDAIKSYDVFSKKGEGTEMMIEVDVDPIIEYEEADLKWKLNLPDETSIRKAIYQKLKNEFEGDE